MAAAPLILMAAGTALSAVGTIGSGMAQAKIAGFEADQMERQATAELASASRGVAEEQRQKRLALSRAQLVGAASGAGRAARVEGLLEQEGMYRSLTALYEGKEAAAGRRAQAGARRAEGSAARTAGFISGAATLAKGGGSLLAKYG